MAELLIVAIGGCVLFLYIVAAALDVMEGVVMRLKEGIWE